MIKYDSEFDTNDRFPSYLAGLILPTSIPSYHLDLQFNILGIGTSGCEIIRYLKDNNKYTQNEDVTFIAIHNNADELKESKADKTLLIADDQLKLDEHQQLELEAKEYLRQCINEQFEEADFHFLFMLTSCIDLETSKITTFLVKLLAEKVSEGRGLFIAIINEPSASEGQMEHGYIELLFKTCHTVIVNSTQRIEKLVNQAQYPFNNYQSQSLVANYQVIRMFINAMTKRSMISCDFGIFCRIVSQEGKTKGKTNFVVGYGQGDKRAQTAIDQAIFDLQQEWGDLKNIDFYPLVMMSATDQGINEYDLVSNTLYSYVSSDEFAPAVWMDLSSSMVDDVMEISVLLIKDSPTF